MIIMFQMSFILPKLLEPLLIGLVIYTQICIYKYLPSYFISHVSFKLQCSTHIPYYLIKRNKKEIK